MQPTSSDNQVEARIEEQVRARLRDWRAHLIDLTLRNRLINYKPTRASTLRVLAPSIDELLANPARPTPFDFYFPPERDDELDLDAGRPPPGVEIDVLGDAVSPAPADLPKERFELDACDPNTIVTDIEDPKRLKRILATLARRSNEELAEKALRILHLAVGFLEWQDPIKGDQLRSPLVLVPVSLARESVQHPYRLAFAEDEDILINPALTLKLEQSGLGLPSEWAWEDKPVMQELTEVGEAVAEHGWTVSHEAVIGVFSFQKLVMYKDLLRNQGKVVAHPTVQLLACREGSRMEHESFEGVPRDNELDPAQDPLRAFSILDADSSQRRCIEAAKRGCSLVMHGPPGTGKSQTIANIIAEALGEQKRVLFISEKIAALDVVHKRLDGKGLGDFCLKLHGRDAVKREVIAALHESLTQKVKPRSAMTEAECERLVELRSRLNEAVELMHRRSGVLLGKTPHEVYGDLAKLEEAPLIGGAPAATPLQDSEARAELQQLVESQRALAQTWPIALDEGFAWRGYARTTFTPEDRAHVVTTLERVTSAARALAGSTDTVATALGVSSASSPRAAGELRLLGETLQQAPPVSASWLERTRLDPLVEAITSSRAAHEALDRSIGAFAAAYPRSDLAAFPPDIDELLKTSLGALEDSIGRTDAWNNGLVPRLRDLADFAGSASERFDALERQCPELSAMLGQPSRRPSAQDVEELTKLANLAFEAKDRPDAQWLVPSGLTVARSALETAAPMFAAYRDRSAAILEHYRPGIFELDVEAIIGRIELATTKRFGKLSGGYRADIKLLKELRTNKALPPTILEDLNEVLAVQALGKRIDDSAGQLKTAFGSWFDGRGTDVDRIARACDVAGHVIDLAAPDSDLRVLGGRVAQGSQPDVALAQQSALVDATLREVSSGFDLMTELSARHADGAFRAQPLEVVRADLQAMAEPAGELAQVIRQLRDGRGGSASSLLDVERDAALVAQAHRDDALVRQERSNWQRIIGDRYVGAATAWDQLDAATAWLGRFFEVFPREPTERILQQLTADAPAWPDFGRLPEGIKAYEESMDALTGLFEDERANDLKTRATHSSVEGVVALTAELGAAVARLPEWTDYRAASVRLEHAGWGDFVRRLREQKVPAHQLEEAMLRAYWQQRLEPVFEESPSLRDFRGRSHDALIAEFRALDKQLITAATDRIIAICNAERPEPIASPGSEVGLLRHEAGKKRRHLPVRKLFARIPELLPALKPCLMMSPLTVSHYLSGDHHFDLVIFDEASQVPPWDAINCIYRGAQLVVAGDNKQLPPTSFFELTSPEDEDQEDDEGSAEEVMESILDSCEAVLPSESLRWHYRSRHEDLIAFSNHHIYNNRLITFPSPVRESDRLGVHLIHVPDGVYDRARSRTNRVEARRVADRVIEHLRLDPSRSIGVVAFSAAQAEAILDALDEVRALHPEYEGHFKDDRLSGIFVKNLETVQGDERDIMIISVGYGRDNQNKFAMQFGPLGKDAGHRRLNVAITRAREQVDVVTSVLASDFRVANQMKAGVRLLRDYIAFAEQGPSALASAIESLGGEYDSPLEESIAGAIRELGYEVVPQVGVGGYRIDLGVLDPASPGRFVLGIECDGATYHSTPTARDRDRLRQEVLEDLGWKIYRVWSTDWIRERRSETGRLDAAIKSACEDASGRVQTQAEPDRDETAEEPRVRERLVVHEIENGEDAARLSWVSTYRRAELDGFRMGYEFHEPGNAENLVRAILTVVYIEGPIEVALAIGRVAEAHGIARRGSRVMDAATRAVDQIVSRGHIERRGEFLWQPGKTFETVRTPSSEDPKTRRSIEQIAPEEIALAIRRLREASGLQDDDSLIVQVARILGFDRTGAQIQSVLKAHLDSFREKGTDQGAS